MKQITLAAAGAQGAGLEEYRKPTRRDTFVAAMQTLVPWSELVTLIEPHYPKAGNGRPPIGLERMLRIHLLQHWFNLPDVACEEASYDSAALRGFVGIAATSSHRVSKTKSSNSSTLATRLPPTPPSSSAFIPRPSRGCWRDVPPRCASLACFEFRCRRRPL